MSPTFPPPAGSSAVLQRPAPGRTVFTALSPAAAPAAIPAAEPLLLPAEAYGELRWLLASALQSPAAAAVRLQRWLGTLPDGARLPALWAAAMQQQLAPAAGAVPRRPAPPAAHAAQAGLEAAAHHTAAAMLARLAPPDGELRLLLLGPGTACTAATVLELLHAAGRPLPARVAVYAAEADPAALLAGERALQRAGTACGLAVRFHALPLRGAVLPAAWPAELTAGGGTLLAYAAGRLPGADPAGPAPSAELLAEVNGLRPRALVLSVPDADLAAAGGPLGRFEAAWPYYEALFRWLGDRLLPAGVRMSLQARYGAGLASVLGEAGPAGAPTPEAPCVRTAEWIRRLQVSGYRPAPLPPGPGIGGPVTDGLRVQPNPWYYGLSYANVNLQSVLCAIPAF